MAAGGLAVTAPEPSTATAALGRYDSLTPAESSNRPPQKYVSPTPLRPISSCVGSVSNISDIFNDADVSEETKRLINSVDEFVELHEVEMVKTGNSSRCPGGYTCAGDERAVLFCNRDEEDGSEINKYLMADEDYKTWSDTEARPSCVGCTCPRLPSIQIACV